MWNKSTDFLKAPVFPSDEGKTRRAELLHYGSWLLFVFPLILISFNLLFGSKAENSINWVLGLIAVLQVVIQRMIRLGFVDEASLILLIIGWSAMTEISRNVDGVRDVAIMGYVLILLASGYLLGWRVATMFTLASIAAIWWLAYMETQGFIASSLGNPNRIALDLTAIFILVFLVIYFMINALTKSLERAQRELAERLRTEQVLASEQERLHLALDAARMGTWDWDIETGKVLWSDKIEVMFGLEKGGFDDRYETYLSCLHPEDRSKVENAIQRSLANEDSDYFVEHRLIWPNGEVHWLEGRGRVYRDGTGRSFRMAGTVVDITERKASEEALRRAEEKYRGIVENALGGIFQSTVDGRFLSVNPAMARMYGYESPEDMLNGITDVVSQLYVDPGLRADMQSRLEAGEQIANFESLDYRKDKSTFWTSMSVQAIRDEYNNIQYYEGIIEDISLRKKVEAERKQVQKELQQRESILEAVTFAAEQFLKTPDWRANIDTVMERLGKTIHATHVYLFENQKLEGKELINTMLFEWTAPGYPSDMEGSKYTNALLDNIDFENWYKLLSKGLPHICDAKHLTPEEMEFLLERGMKAKLEVPIFFDEKWWGTIGFDDMANQREWTSAEIDALKVAGNVLGAAIQRQIADAALQNELSQRTKLIKELEAKNTELERFTYTVSHDLKAPLVTISGFLGYLEKDMISGDLDRFQLDSQRIQDAVNRMRLLLGELLELSRIGRMMNPPQSIPFIDLVNGGVEAVQGLIDMRGITVQIQPDMPAVHGDRQRLTEVLQNLIDNAAKFMGDQPNPQIEIGQHGEEDGKPIFYVKDNGTGIPHEYHERIFGLFNKLDPNTDGTGIGLALVKRIIEVHGGRIWVESEGVGHGATFLFTLTSQRIGEEP